MGETTRGDAPRHVQGAAFLALLLVVTAAAPAAARIINVPANQPDLRAAVAAAASSDTILIAPGTWLGGAFVQDKVLTIGSRYLTTGDTTFIAQTVLDGVSPDACGGGTLNCQANSVLEFGANAHGSAVIGLTLANGENGVGSMSIVDIIHCRVISNGDGMDYTSGSGGLISDDLFENNTDDGIDLNGRMNMTITNNVIRNNRDDGIEFRLYAFSGSSVTVAISGNQISGNGEDGIQFIDYPEVSAYTLRVERNVFTANYDASGSSAAIGVMPNGDTIESLVGAPMAERLYVIHNTFVNESYGLVGGANTIALDNIFTGTLGSAVRQLTGGSVASYSMFWNNGLDTETSVVDAPHLIHANPLLTATGTLGAGSPAIDAGAAFFRWNNETVLNEPAGSYFGSAPDLGAFEYTSGGPVNHAPTVSAGVNLTITLPAGAMLSGTVGDDGLPSPPAKVTTSWSVASASGPMVIHDPDQLQTMATFAWPGTYALRLTASDGALTNSDVVAITVLPSTNVAPTVEGGPNQTVTLPADAALHGTAGDDGLPNPPATLTTSWVKESGPGNVSFVNAGAADTRASFSSAGSYLLVLIASDGAISTRDSVQVTVFAEPNTAPVVDAGPIQVIELPNDVALDGTVSDDGHPLTPGTVTTSWAMLSGPGPVTFQNPSLVDTRASFTTPGTYVLKLTAFDGVLTGSSTTTISVLPPNTAPSVDAGPDQTVPFGSDAVLDGTVQDDGQPLPTSMTTAWSKVSGPGTVAFQNAALVDTRATFAVSGSYVLKLTANDGALAASDLIQITVVPPPPPIDRRIAVASDDTEEETPGGAISSNTSDIEMVTGTTLQIDGLRFTNITVPKGAPILSAWIQFEADETQSEATSLVFQGQAADNPPTFTTASLNVSSRPRTSASVNWSPVPWTLVGEQGANQRTSDLKPIIQELVNRPGWVSGNAIVIIVSGSGHRTARAFETVPAGAALLHVEYGSGVPANTAPLVDAGVNQTITLPSGVTLSGTASDDGLPNPPAAMTFTWSKGSGPGTVGFQNPAALATTATFSAAGTYVLRLTASDGALSAYDSLQVTVLPPPNTAPLVDAGPNQTITLPATASLIGSVSDDGLPNPPATVTVTWSKGSGPGSVTFQNANAISTTATFSTAGTYIVRLTASDGALSAHDSLQILVQPQNQPPTANAGTDQTIMLPASATLAGSASDDGFPNPPGALTIGWSAVSGPGTVTFGNASQLSTTASFSVAGVYQLRLGVSDGSLSAADTVRITAMAGQPPIDRRIAASADDAEESASGTTNLTSANLQLVFNATNQIDGLRFTNITIPRGATITSATVQFTAELVESGVTTLGIRAQAADNPTPFTGVNLNVSSRPVSVDSVAWAPPAWAAVGEAATAERTPDLKVLIQALVNRAGWASGNALVLIVRGSGVRTAYSYDGNAALAPLLHVDYATGAEQLAATGDSTGASPGDDGIDPGVPPGSDPSPIDGIDSGSDVDGTGNGVARPGNGSFHVAPTLAAPPVELALRALGASPARRAVTVECSLPDARPAAVTLHDISGRCVASRELTALGPGRHAIELARNLRAGVYVVRLVQGGSARIAKVAVLP